MIVKKNKKGDKYVYIILVVLIIIFIPLFFILVQQEGLSSIIVLIKIITIFIGLELLLTYLVYNLYKSNIKKLSKNPEKMKKFLNKPLKVASYIKLDDGYEELTLKSPVTTIVSYKKNNLVDIIIFYGAYGSIFKKYYREIDFKDNKELFENADLILQTYKNNIKSS